MNLNAYDNVIEKIDKTKTWVDIRKKQLLSKEIKFRKYTCLLKRFDIRTNICKYFIAMLDEPPEDRKYKSTSVDDYGRVKIALASIWKDTYLAKLGSNVNICINLVESGEDGDIYFLDV